MKEGQLYLGQLEKTSLSKGQNSYAEMIIIRNRPAQLLGLSGISGRGKRLGRRNECGLV
jgi:hypothetical protein